jgi:5'-nucleotidase
MTQIENIALFDMDGTLCDYDKSLKEELAKLSAPGEPTFKTNYPRNAPKWLENRRNLITKSQDWWANLPKFQLGWDVLDVAKDLDYRLMILTQGPATKPLAWSGKHLWLNEHLPGVDITMTRDKSLVYGKVLVDDFPDYIMGWLGHRPRGLVIMPANEGNKDFRHEQVIRYDGTNLDQVREAMDMAKLREF